MSTRESGSDTWPRFTAFPRDNLDLGNVTEEGDVNHEPEPPSWMSGAAAVGTGAGPPSEDQEPAEDRNGRVSRSDVGTADDDAPRFSDHPPDTGWGELPSDEPGFGAPGGAPGYGQAPPAAPGFGAAPDTDPFGAPRPAIPGSVSRLRLPRASSPGRTPTTPRITRATTPARTRGAATPRPRPTARTPAAPPVRSVVLMVRSVVLMVRSVVLMVRSPVPVLRTGPVPR